MLLKIFEKIYSEKNFFIEKFPKKPFPADVMSASATFSYGFSSSEQSSMDGPQLDASLLASQKYGHNCLVMYPQRHSHRKSSWFGYRGHCKNLLLGDADEFV